MKKAIRAAGRRLSNACMSDRARGGRGRVFIPRLRHLDFYARRGDGE